MENPNTPSHTSTGAGIRAGVGAGRAKPLLWQDLWDFQRLVMRRFGRDEGLRIAAALSYTTLLALVPLGAIAFSVLKAFVVFDTVQQQIKAVLFDNFLPAAVAEVQVYFDQFIAQTAGLTTLGIVALAASAVMMLGTIETALNSIFRVQQKRPFVARMMMFWAVLTLGPLLLGGSLSLTTYLYALGTWAGADNIPGLGGAVAWMLPGVLAVGGFAVFYTVVPHRPVRVRHALIGAIVAGVLFGALRWLFGIYITAFPAYQTIYGALAAVPIFLIWMYLSWSVVLIGAEIAAALPHWGRADQRGRQGGRYEDLPSAQKLSAALAVMEQLWRQGRGEEGGGAPHVALSEEVQTQILETLRHAGIVALSDQGRWLLARDVDVLHIFDVAYGLGLAPSPEDLSSTDPWQRRLKEALRRAQDGGYGATLKSVFAGTSLEPGR